MVKMENDMKIETQGYGSSMVATKYVYERINDIIANSEDEHRIKINTFMELHKSMLSELKELQEEFGDINYMCNIEGDVFVIQSDRCTLVPASKTLFSDISGTDTIAATELADLHSHLKSKHSIL